MVILVDDMREGGGWFGFVPVCVSVVVEEEERAEAGMTLETTEDTVERSTFQYKLVEGNHILQMRHLLFSVRPSKLGLTAASASKSA